MKNDILKIINEKYEKYSIGKIKCPKSEHFGMRHSDCLIMLVLEFILRVLPHIFRENSIKPPPAKNGPYAYGNCAVNCRYYTFRERSR